MTNVGHPNAAVPDSVGVPRVGALRYELGAVRTKLMIGVPANRRRNGHP
jgi:hypothetical protein